MSISFNDLLRAAAPTAALVFLTACAGHEPPAPGREAVTADVEVVQSSTVPVTRSVAGSVRAATVTSVSAQLLGTVTRVHVREGDRVRAGQLLVEIDDRAGQAGSARARAGGVEIDRAIEAAQVNARLAEATYARYASLHERRSVSAQEFDDVKARRDAANAELQRLIAGRAGVRAARVEADTYLDYTRLRAPMSGVVTARFVDPGAQAAPGMPLLTIEEQGRYRVETTADEEIASTLRRGDPVTVDLGSRRVEARVSRIVPALQSATRSALVQIDLDGAVPVRSGSFARVSFPLGSRGAVTVPSSAIARRGQLASVFAVGPDQIARLRLITVGETFDGRSEVLSGIDPGEKVVTRAAASLRDGMRIGS